MLIFFLQEKMMPHLFSLLRKPVSWSFPCRILERHHTENYKLKAFSKYLCLITTQCHKWLSTVIPRAMDRRPSVVSSMTILNIQGM